MGRATLASLKRAPHGILLPQNRGRAALGKRHKILRKGGKVDVAPSCFVTELAALPAEFARELEAQGTLKLISKRERASHNTWMHNVESFVRPPRHTNYLYMHPADAQARNLRDGDIAEVRTAMGAVRAPVKTTDKLMRGAVALPHGWGHDEAEGLSVAQKTRGVNVNRLAADGPLAVERLSGMAHLTGLVVEIERVSVDRRDDDRTPVGC
jgi:anaerobic selenocysteine-containing dehydrogenase